MAAPRRAGRQPQGLDAYMQNTLLIADQEVRNALGLQGLLTFDDFTDLTDEEIENICEKVRKPGGTIVNPNAAIAGQPPTIPNPGVLISQLTEKRLKMLAYYMMHLRRVQRLPINVNEATLARLASVYLLKDYDETEDDLELPMKFSKIESARLVTENLDDYLLRKKGVQGTPLAYVTRETVPLPTVDPGFGLPTFVQEMVQRAPHNGAYYQADNVTVWNAIRHVTHGTIAWNWVSRYATNRDGRNAYLSFKSHYMGSSYQQRIRTLADGKINSAFYDGKNRNFTFEAYCGVLNNAFADIEATGEEITESRKVRYLLNGIQDPRLETAKSQILVSEDIQASFESSVNFIARFIDSKKSYNSAKQSRNISSANTNGSGRGRGNQGRGRGNGQRNAGTAGRGNANNKKKINNTNININRYIPPNEWMALPAEQRQQIREERSKQNQRSESSVNTSNERNVRFKSEDSQTAETSTTQPSSTSTLTSTSIGAVMSRRQGTGHTQQL